MGFCNFIVVPADYIHRVFHDDSRLVGFSTKLNCNKVEKCNENGLADAYLFACEQCEKMALLRLCELC